MFSRNRLFLPAIAAFSLTACNESQPSDDTMYEDEVGLTETYPDIEGEDELIEGPLDYLDLSETSLADFDMTLEESVSLFGLKIFMSKAATFTKLGEQGFAPTGGGEIQYQYWSNGDVTIKLEFDWLNPCIDDNDPPLMGWVLTRAELDEKTFPKYRVSEVGYRDPPPVYPAELAAIVEKNIGPANRLRPDFEIRKARRSPALAHAEWCTDEDPMCYSTAVFSTVDGDGDTRTTLYERGSADLPYREIDGVQICRNGRSFPT